MTSGKALIRYFSPLYFSNKSKEEYYIALKSLQGEYRKSSKDVLDLTSEAIDFSFSYRTKNYVPHRKYVCVVNLLENRKDKKI